MTTTINASTSGSGGLVQTADASGILALQTAGVTAVTVNASQNVGVGTGSPTARLHSYASSGTTTTLGRFEAAVGSYTGTSLVAANTLGPSSSYNLFSCITDSDGDAGGPFTEFLISGDGFVFMDSGYGSAAVAYGCRAWVNFNGTGTPTITGSGNVSSLTDIAAGRYNVNLTTAMPDTVYSVVTGVTKGGGGPSASNSAWSNAGEGRGTGYFLLEVYDWNFNGFDSAFVQAALFR